MGVFGRVFYTVGVWIRETGQALDRLGSRLEGNYHFQEQRTYLTFNPNTKPYFTFHFFNSHFLSVEQLTHSLFVFNLYFGFSV